MVEELDMIVTKSNSDELNKLIDEYNSLIAKLKVVSQKIIDFEPKIETMPAIEYYT